jgi:hypothetical protein
MPGAAGYRERGEGALRAKEDHMLRVGLAGLMALHGIAHWVGFAVPWRLVQADEMPYSTQILGGRVDVGDAGIRVFGVAWLLLGIAFLLVAAAAWVGRPDWPLSALAVVGASFVMCVLGLPAARIGIRVNAVLLVVVLGGRVAGWW